MLTDLLNLAMSQLYVYEPLSGPQNIRLLKILDKDGLITCTLEEIDLTRLNCQEYHALSYTWGHPDGTEAPKDLTNSKPPRHFVLCNGKELMVTENCYDALRQLRSEIGNTGGDEVIESLWIDAICIDQTNIAEKNFQVAMMGRIYAKAKAVIAWIGKPDADTIEAASLIWKIGTALDDEIPGLASKDWSSYQFNDPIFFEKCGMPPVTLRQWRLILKFFMKRWFQRGWVVQEIALASEAFIYCGEFLHVDPLFMFAVFITYSGWLFAAAHIRSISFPDAGKSGHINLIQVAGMLRVYQSRGPAHPSYRKKYKDYFKAETSTEWQYTYLETIITSMNQFLVTDPRDKVFAPLALVSYYVDPSTKSQWMVPDYTLSTKQVYVDVSCKILRNSNTLSFLSAVEHSVDRKVQDLPSWVPDLNTFKTATSLALMPPLRHATQHWANLKNSAECNESSGILKVNGIISDSVVAISPHLEAILTLHSVWDWLTLIAQLPRESYVDQHPLEVLRRVLIADQPYNLNGEIAEGLHQSFRSYILFEMAMALVESKKRGEDITAFWDCRKVYTEYAANDEFLPTTAEVVAASNFQSRDDELQWDHMPQEFAQMGEYRASLGRVSAGRRLLLTQKGLIGLGPTACGIGDSIAFLQGGRIPVVLRAAAAEYELMGEAYIHGFMDGQIAQWGPPEFVQIILK